MPAVATLSLNLETLMSLACFSKSAIVALALGCAALSAHAAPILWLSTGAPSHQLATVDVATGRTSVIGNTIDTFDRSILLTDIAFDPTGNLFGISFDNLFSVNTITAAVTRIGRLGTTSEGAEPRLGPIEGNATGLVFAADGTLYMAGSTLYKVDTHTGLSTAVGSGIGFQSAGDLAFIGGELYMATSDHRLVKIDTTTGVGIDIGPIGVTNVFGLATPDNVTLYGMAGQTVFTIDTRTGAAGALVSFDPALVSSAAGGAFRSEAGAPISEPASLALVGLALLAAGAARRRAAARA